MTERSFSFRFDEDVGGGIPLHAITFQDVIMKRLEVPKNLGRNLNESHSRVHDT